MIAAENDNTLEVRIRDLKLDFFIGVLQSEKGRRQPVNINIWLATSCDWRHTADDISAYISYADIVAGIRAIADGSKHINLVETLAEKICDIALNDARATRVRVTVEKTTIIPEATAVGVTLQRSR